MKPTSVSFPASGRSRFNFLKGSPISTLAGFAAGKALITSRFGTGHLEVWECANILNPFMTPLTAFCYSDGADHQAGRHAPRSPTGLLTRTPPFAPIAREHD